MSEMVTNKKLILLVNVDIGGACQEVISVHEGDHPQVLAEEFCNKNHLSYKLIGALTDHISMNLAKLGKESSAVESGRDPGRLSSRRKSNGQKNGKNKEDIVGSIMEYCRNLSPSKLKSPKFPSELYETAIQSQIRHHDKTAKVPPKQPKKAPPQPPSSPSSPFLSSPHLSPPFPSSPHLSPPLLSQGTTLPVHPLLPSDDLSVRSIACLDSHEEELHKASSSLPLPSHLSPPLLSSPHLSPPLLSSPHLSPPLLSSPHLSSPSKSKKNLGVLAGERLHEWGKVLQVYRNERIKREHEQLIQKEMEDVYRNPQISEFARKMERRDLPIWERSGAEYHWERERRRGEEREKREIEELNQCTFHPVIGDKSKKIVKALQSYYNLNAPAYEYLYADSVRRRHRDEVFRRISASPAHVGRPRVGSATTGGRGEERRWGENGREIREERRGEERRERRGEEREERLDVEEDARDVWNKLTSQKITSQRVHPKRQERKRPVFSPLLSSPLPSSPISPISPESEESLIKENIFDVFAINIYHKILPLSMDSISYDHADEILSSLSSLEEEYRERDVSPLIFQILLPIIKFTKKKKSSVTESQFVQAFRFQCQKFHMDERVAIDMMRTFVSIVDSISPK